MKLLRPLIENNNFRLTDNSPCAVHSIRAGTSRCPSPPIPRAYGQRALLHVRTVMHHSFATSHSVAYLLPGPALAAPNPRTQRSSIARHPHQLQHDHPARTASWCLRRDYPTPPQRHAICYRHLSYSTGPSSRECRLLKPKPTVTSSIPTG